MNDDAWPAACGVLERLEMECRTAKFGSLPPTNIHFWSTNDSTIPHGEMGQSRIRDTPKSQQKVNDNSITEMA